MRLSAILASLGLLAFPHAPRAQVEDPARVLVVYDQNAADGDGNGVGDSLQVAQYYAARRGVPGGNLLALNCSTSLGYGNVASFRTEVLSVIQGYLTIHGLQSVDTLLFSYATPYQLNGTNQGTLSLDHALQRPWSLPTSFSGFAFTGVPNSYFEASPTIGGDKAHFSHAYKSGNKDMYLVARLDGYDVHQALVLVDRALYAERYLWNAPGYYGGNGYVDSRFKVYTDADLAVYPQGHNSYDDCDIDQAFGKNFVLSFGWPLKWHNDAGDFEIGEGGTFQDGSSGLAAPQALWYAGWYNYLKYQDVWEWLPGSVACDLDSLSLYNIRDKNQISFGTQAFVKGLTCCNGVIAEPYTVGHPYGEVLIYYMMKGYTFAEAATLSEPKLQWVSLKVGDPLYRPMYAGKVPVLDTAAPPQAALTVKGSPSAVQPLVVASLDNLALAEPEVVLARLEYGTFGAYSASVDFGKVHHTRHAWQLSGLAPDAIHDLRVSFKDPVGNTTVGQSWIYLSKSAAPVAAVASTPDAAPAAGQPVSVRLALAVAPDLAAGWDGRILLSHPGLGVVDLDITNLALPYVNALDFGPAGEAIGVTLAFPAGVIPPGSATFGLVVTSQSASDTSGVTIQVP